MAAAPDEEKQPGLPKPVRLKQRRPLNIQDIETAISAGRE
jgi:hypothetical protein